MKRLNFARLMAVTGVLSLLCAVACADDWAGWGHDAARQRASSENGFVMPLVQEWTFNVPGGYAIASSPCVYGGMVYFGTRDGKVIALTAVDGQLAWSVQTDDIVDSTPVVSDGRLVVCSRDGSVYCLDAESGQALWITYVAGNNVSSPTVSGGIVYFGSGFPNSHVFALSLADGSEVWSYACGQTVYSSPAVYGGFVYIGCNDGVLYCIDAITGALSWTQSTLGAGFMSSPLAFNNLIYYVPGGNDAGLYCMNFNGGTVWTRNVNTFAKPQNPPLPVRTFTPQQYFEQGDPGSRGMKPAFTGPNSVQQPPGSWSPVVVSSPAIANSRVYFVSGGPDMRLFAVDAATGATSWSVPIGNLTEHSFASSPACAGGYVFVGSQEGTFYAFNGVTGAQVFSQALGTQILSSPAVSNGKVFVGTSDGVMYAFDAGNDAPLPPVSGFSPANGQTIADSTPTISWDAASDPNSGSGTLVYFVRFDDDADLLTEYSLGEYSTFAGSTSFTLTDPFPDNTRIYYRIRTVDPQGASSAWSETQNFFVNRNTATPPSPPSNFTAVPQDGAAGLSWTASPSNDVQYYWLAWGLQGGPLGAPVRYDAGVLSCTVNGLVNGITYGFSLWAEDFDANSSTAVTTTCAPYAGITVFFAAGGQATFPDLAAAVAATASGDTIRLAAGTFALAGTLNVPQGVSITGYAPGYTVIDGGAVGTMISIVAGVGAAGTISGLSLLNGLVGVESVGGAVNVRNCVLARLSTGIRASAGATVNVINNTFAHNVGNAMELANTSAAVRNNIVIHNRGFGIFVNGGTVTPGYNDFYANGLGNYSGVVAGTGDISADIIFLDELADDYREASGEAHVDAGDPADPYAAEPYYNGRRVNMGAFGNTQFATKTPAPPTGGGGGGGGCFMKVYGSLWPILVVIGLFVLLAVAWLGLSRAERQGAQG
jgi:outer membrane protein assembly factor BamB